MFELYELNFDGFNEIEIGWNFEGDGDCNYFWVYLCNSCVYMVVYV